jgi:hypothetical protein
MKNKILWIEDDLLIPFKNEICLYKKYIPLSRASPESLRCRVALCVSNQAFLIFVSFLSEKKKKRN